MLNYAIRRVLAMIPTLFAISIIVFAIIRLPPGDYLTTAIAELEAQGEGADPQKIAFLRQAYGLDQPAWRQYLDWAGGLLHGDLGYSFAYNLPVGAIIGDRLGLTVLVSAATILFTWAVAFPIGVYTATHRHRIGDYLFNLLGLIGLAVPNFLAALILLYAANAWFGLSIGGLMDDRFVGQDWSLAKLGSVMAHLCVPVIVIGMAGTAGLARRLRANLLDELDKPAVAAARAKGLSPLTVLIKYPLRAALNPFIADLGMLLPQIVSGSAIISVVLSLPTTGPLLLDALRSQDTQLAGSLLMFLAFLTVIGTLLSDLALAVLDPRIRLTGGADR
jgi:peptide/nickel transport system permease protein